MLGKEVKIKFFCFYQLVVEQNGTTRSAEHSFFKSSSCSVENCEDRGACKVVRGKCMALGGLLDGGKFEKTSLTRLITMRSQPNCFDVVLFCGCCCFACCYCCGC